MSDEEVSRFIRRRTTRAWVMVANDAGRRRDFYVYEQSALTGMNTRIVDCTKYGLRVERAGFYNYDWEWRRT